MKRISSTVFHKNRIPIASTAQAFWSGIGERDICYSVCFVIESFDRIKEGRTRKKAQKRREKKRKIKGVPYCSGGI